MKDFLITRTDYNKETMSSFAVILPSEREIKEWKAQPQLVDRILNQHSSEFLQHAYGAIQ